MFSFWFDSWDHIPQPLQVALGKCLRMTPVTLSRACANITDEHQHMVL